MTAAQLGVVSSIFTLGGLIGALSTGPATSRYGRLSCMKFATFFFVIGPVFETLSPNIGVLAFGRFVSGLGAGSSLVAVPLYISEVSPPQERGFFGAFTQIMTNLGIFVTQTLGYFFSHDQYWRIVLATAGVIGAVQFVGLWTAVESPKWLAEQGRLALASKTLRRIRGDKFDTEDEIRGWNIHSEQEEGNRPSDLPDHADWGALLDNMADSVAEEHAGLLANETDPTLSPNKPNKGRREEVTFFQVVQHPEHRRAVIAVIMVMIAQQFTG